MVDETGKVTFTPEEQAEVDRVVGERLGREKAKFDGHEDLKEIAETLKAFGYEGTPAEIKAAVKQQADAYKQEQELARLQEEAKKTGTSPELQAKIDRLEKKLTELEKEKEDKTQEAENQKQAEAAWNKQVEEFEEKHSDIDLAELSKNEKFMRFLERSNPNLSISEVYEDFVDMIGGVEAEAIAKVKSKEQRSTSGGKGAKNPDGNSYGLTEAQKKEVDAWNKRYPKTPMSYKEYANR